MPDKRRHRGKHPDDERLFAIEHHESLRSAVSEHSWLLTHGYAGASALKLVGDRYDLTVRQRMAVRRSSCSDERLQRRTSACVSLAEAVQRALAIDGYNLLITIESALSGGLVLIGRDGCYRDLASVHGTYRKVEETAPAVELIVEFLTAGGVTDVDWFLDKPVSNSGRLKALIADVVNSSSNEAGARRWNITLADSPDAMLSEYSGLIVTTDSAVLDRSGSWVNLAAEMVATRVPDAWVLDLRTGDEID